MKGLILAGGAGTRLRPITHTSAKQLVPIANKPIIFYGIEQLAAAGIKHIAIVIAEGDTGTEIQAAVGDGSQFGVEISYIEQDAPRAGALRAHRPRLPGRRRLRRVPRRQHAPRRPAHVRRRVPRRARPAARAGRGSREPPAAQILLAHVEDPRNFGVAEFDVHGDIVRLVEKPADPPSDLALVGVYLFSPAIHDAVRAIRPSARNELEITDAIQQLLIDDGHQVRHEILRGWWIDTGKKDPLLHCNRLVLDTIEHRVDGHVDDQSRVERRVVIEEGVQLIRSVVRGPAIIGARTRLVDTYVGPYTSIAADCELIDTEIENSRRARAQPDPGRAPHHRLAARPRGRSRTFRHATACDPPRSR